jgi:hypothetical protein
VSAPVAVKANRPVVLSYDVVAVHAGSIGSSDLLGNPDHTSLWINHQRLDQRKQRSKKVDRHVGVRTVDGPVDNRNRDQVGLGCGLPTGMTIPVGSLVSMSVRMPFSSANAGGWRRSDRHFGAWLGAGRGVLSPIFAAVGRRVVLIVRGVRLA